MTRRGALPGARPAAGGLLVARAGRRARPRGASARPGRPGRRATPPGSRRPRRGGRGRCCRRRRLPRPAAPRPARPGRCGRRGRRHRGRRRSAAASRSPGPPVTTTRPPVADQRRHDGPRVRRIQDRAGTEADGCTTTYGVPGRPAGAPGSGVRRRRRPSSPGARTWPAAAARARAAVTSCPPSGHRRRRHRRPCAGRGRPAASRGSPRWSPTTRGTPASRHSSAIGSGLWWNEVKITASSYDRSRSCATRASHGGRDRWRGRRIRTTAGRRPARRRPGQQVRGGQARRRDQEVDAAPSGGEGPHRRAGEQHVAVVVEPHREDPARSSPRTRGAVADRVHQIRCHDRGSREPPRRRV